MTPADLLALAEREYGAIKHSLPVYWRGALCWAVAMVWPVRWFRWLPSAILACAGDYAHDARQYAKGLAASLGDGKC